MYHPTTKEIFEFIDEAGYTEGEMFFALRIFIANEYDRDPAILERLKTYFKNMKEAEKEFNKAQ